MKHDITNSIHNIFQEKTTEELLEIWTKNNKNEYTSEAFDEIKMVLLERNINIPNQNIFFEEHKTLKKHSDLGIASFIVSMIVFIPHLLHMSFFSAVKWGYMNGDYDPFVIIYKPLPLFFLVSLGLSIAGLFQPDTKKTFCIFGILNYLIGLIIMLIVIR